MSFLKGTSIPQNVQMSFGPFIIQFQSQWLWAMKLNCSDFCNSHSCRVLPFYRNFLY